ncbi:MAG: replication initiator protein [Microvirus sp.]|nr:MAG: replication initiator protein [Microvirus sp.]
MNAFKLKEENGGYLVPCGKCLNCRRRRVSSWSVRLVKEGERSFEAVFLTLTYNNDNVPISDMGYLTLKKKDVQDYMKRLRKAHPADHKKLTYYAVGEYGSKTKRPHYHLILFNADPTKLHSAWHLKGKPLGDIYIGNVVEASIGYCLKYISKICYIGKDQKIDDRQPNFSLMSKGIGLNYISTHSIQCLDQTIFRDKNGNWSLKDWITKTVHIPNKPINQWHKAIPEQRVYVPLKDGNKAPLPRYFKKLIYNESEKERIAFHFQKESQKLLEEEIAEHGDNLQYYKTEQYLHANKKMLLNKNSKL